LFHPIPSRLLNRMASNTSARRRGILRTGIIRARRTRRFSENMVAVGDRSVYKHVVYQTDIEKSFAEHSEKNEVSKDLRQIGGLVQSPDTPEPAVKARLCPAPAAMAIT